MSVLSVLNKYFQPLINLIDYSLIDSAYLSPKYLPMNRQLLSTLLYFLIPMSLFSQLEVVEYKLDNGFTVILNPDKTSNLIFGAVAVNTGSKNDPIDATGMSHYLEHLLFKGTEELGTSDYEKEKPLLDSIRYYYDQLGSTHSDKAFVMHIL